MQQHQLDKKTKRTLFLILAAFVLVVVLLIRVVRGSSDIYYDIDQTPVTLDPQLVNDSVSDTIVKNTFEGLMKKDVDGNLVKGIASDYHESEDGLVYTFKIKPNAIWANGEKVTSYDFVFAFTRLLDPKTKSPTAYRFSNIKGASGSIAGTHSMSQVGIKALDDLTVQFTLEKKDHTFLNALTLPAAMPCNEAFFNETSGAYGMSGKATLTNGVFTVSNVTPEESITIKKNKNYRTGDPASVDSVLFIVKTAEERLARFEKGTTDLFFYQSPQSRDDLPKNTEDFQTKTWVLLFNPKSEEFQNLDNRKAFIAGIPKDFLEERLPFSYSPAKTLYGNRISVGGNVYSDLIGTVAPSYNVQEAKNLLKIDNDEANQLSLLVKKDSHSEAISTEISQAWQKNIAVFVKQEAVDERELLKRVQDGDFTFAIVPVSDFLSTRETSVGSLAKSAVFPNNFSATVENLRKEFLASASPNHQKEILIESEKVFYQNAYLYPLYNETEYFSTSKKARNITYLPEDNVIDFRKAKK